MFCDIFLSIFLICASIAIILILIMWIKLMYDTFFLKKQIGGKQMFLIILPCVVGAVVGAVIAIMGMGIAFLYEKFFG